MIRSSARRGLLKGLGAATLSACLPLAPRSGTAATPRIGFLNGNAADLLAAFNDELRRLGYIDGTNVAVEKRLTRPNTSDGAAMAAELANLDLDFIVAGALPFALAVRRVNPMMPMVIATCPGMVSNGFAASLEKPGGIYTGMDELPAGVTAKRMELLKTAAPSVTRVALLSTTPGRGGHETQLAEARQAARTLGVDVRAYRAATLGELHAALALLRVDGVNGLLSFQGGLALANRDLIVQFAALHGIPAIYQATLFAEAGGLLAWAPDLVEQFREAARLAAKILDGARPGDLPVEHPAAYYLTVNATAARGLGLDLPQPLLAQAARVVA